MGIMNCKRGLILGLANEYSLAWGVAQALHREGAELAVSFQGERQRDRVLDLAGRLEISKIFECDVSNYDAIDQMFNEIEKDWDSIDFILHAIGYSDRNELRGRFIHTSLNNFLTTMNISVFSLTAIASRAHRMMKRGGSLLTISYFGAEKALPNYNIMGVAKAALEATVRYLALDLGPEGIRVNAISAGPIKTVAATGIGDFRQIMQYCKNASPLRRNVSIDDVGNVATYLLSHWSDGVTGEIHHVDAGFHAVAMPSDFDFDNAPFDEDSYNENA